MQKVDMSRSACIVSGSLALILLSVSAARSEPDTNVAAADASIPQSASAWSPEEFIYTPADIQSMRERFRQEPADGPLHGLVTRGGQWLKTIHEPGYLETMLPADAPLGETWFSQVCPACTNRSSIRWEGHRERGRLECDICKTVFPNPKFPESSTYTANGRTYGFHKGKNNQSHHFSAFTRYKRVRWTMKSNRPHQYLAIAWLLTGDKRYARGAADFLLRYAQVYKDWFWHDNGPGVLMDVDDPEDWVPKPVSVEDMRERGPGYTSKTRWIFDSIFLTEFAFAYGAIRTSGVMNADEHKLLLDLARETLEWNLLPHLYYKSRAFGNVHGWMYDTVILAGRAFGTDLVCEDILFGSFKLNGVDLIHEMYDGPKGLVYACENLVDREGCYSESGGAYYQQIAGSVVSTLVRVKGYMDPPGYQPSAKVAPYYRGRRKIEPGRDIDLRRLFGYYGVITSGGEFPAINDSNVGLRPRPGVFFNAYLATGDKVSRAMFKALAPDAAPHYSGYGLHYIPTLKDISSESVWESENQPRLSLFSGIKSNTGIGVLRGAGQTDLYLNWDAQNSSHVQYEQLGMVLFAGTREALLDFGYRGAGRNIRNLWINRTIAHNTVTVDENVQHSNQRGELERGGDFGRVRIVQASDNKAFRELDRYRRTVVLIDIDKDNAYCLDLFEVEGAKTHDQSWLANGKLLGIGGAPLGARKGTLLGEETGYGDTRPVPGMPAGPGWTGHYGSGYGFIDGLFMGNCTGHWWTADWQIGKGPLKLRIMGAASPDDVLIRGMCPHERDGDSAEQRDRKGPIVIVRRETGNDTPLSSLFASAIEPYRENPQLVSVRRLSSGRGIDATFHTDPVRRDSLHVDNDGRLTYESWSGDDLRELILMGQGTWGSSGWSVTVSGSVSRTGSVIDVDGENVSLLVDAPLPEGEALSGKLIFLSRRGESREHFTVQSVSSDGERSRVFVDRDVGGFANNRGMIDDILDSRTFVSGTYFKYYVWGEMHKGDVILIGRKAFRIADVDYLGWKHRHRVKVQLETEAFPDRTGLGRDFVVSAVAPGDRWEIEMPVHVVRQSDGTYDMSSAASVSVRAPSGVEVNRVRF